MKITILTLIYFLSAALLFGGEPVKITGEENGRFMNPKYSPDGNYIAFTSDKYKGLWIYDINEGYLQNLSEDQSAGFGFKWSPTSDEILSVVNKYENKRRLSAVKIYNIDKNDSKMITDYGTGLSGLTAWSSDATTVYYYDNHKLVMQPTGRSPLKTDTQLQAIALCDGDRLKIRKAGKSTAESPAFTEGKRVLNAVLSPDGSKIAFQIMGGAMYVMNTDGTGVVNLGTGYRPSWSPDSKSLAYMITEDDGHLFTSSDIYRIDVNGTNKKKLTDTDDLLEMDPDWSPDGQSIVFDTYNEGGIYTMEIN